MVRLQDGGLFLFFKQTFLLTGTVGVLTQPMRSSLVVVENPESEGLLCKVTSTGTTLAESENYIHFCVGQLTFC